MKKIMLLFIFGLWFVGCSNNINIVPEKITQDKIIEKEFDELDKIEAQMKDELSPGTNAVKQINFKVCK